MRIGLNSRLDTIQAAILLPKLKAFKDYELQKRNEVATVYTKGLKDKYVTPTVLPGFTSSWAQYTLLLENAQQRAELQDKLKEASIPSMVYYPKCLHQQTCYAELGYKTSDLPNAERASQGVLSLPMSPWIKKEEQEKVIKICIG